jgi:hypothetical protein
MKLRFGLVLLFSGAFCLSLISLGPTSLKALAGSNSASSSSKSAVVEVKLTMSDYLVAMSGGQDLSKVNSISMSLPLLLIFDPKGVEVYKVAASQHIVQDLQNLQGKLSTLKPVESQVTLNYILTSLSGTQPNVQSLRAPYSGYTLLFIRSEPRHSTAEADAEAALNRFLLKSPANSVRALELEILGIT